eukprot:TRINITY_DN11773_c1_g1_i1.p1 TRINITY_DN11773_c1_g1~~TRINITY_DN11773_c1_g1_i1.p1  ORF type:complete len:393 (+),score=35.44 TRINITY_DN11773_c1_g1_i1:1323-2501(+)
MNTPVQQIKDWLDKYEAKVIFNMQKLQLEAAKEEEKEKRRVAELKSAAPLVHDRRGTLPGGEEESQQISRLKKRILHYLVTHLVRHTRSQEGIKPLFTNEVSSSEDVVKNIPRISQRRILPLESARSIPKTDLQQTPAFRTEDQRGGSKNVGPVGKILETIKSTLGDQQVEDGGENSLGEIKVEIIPEEVGKRIGTIMEEEIKGEAEEKQVLDMQKIDLSSIQVKKEDLGISALTFGDESVFNGDKDAQRNNQKPEGFLEDVSPISFKSKDKDKSSFAYPFQYMDYDHYQYYQIQYNVLTVCIYIYYSMQDLQCILTVKIVSIIGIYLLSFRMIQKTTKIAHSYKNNEDQSIILHPLACYRVPFHYRVVNPPQEPQESYQKSSSHYTIIQIL